MSVKKMGSKLVQGVRQIKAQQDNAPPAITAETTTATTATTDVKKTGVARAVTKPAPVKTVDSSVLHPARIWPD